MEAIASRRCTLFAAASAAILGGGITAGVATSVADYAEMPDAELIRLCAEFDVLERRRRSDLGRDPQQQEPILVQICAMPAVSLEELGAIAASLVLWDGELFIECDKPGVCTNERLKLALLPSVMAVRA